MDSNVTLLLNSMGVFRKRGRVVSITKLCIQKYWHHIMCTLQIAGNGANPVPCYDMPPCYDLDMTMMCQHRD